MPTESQPPDPFVECIQRMTATDCCLAPTRTATSGCCYCCGSLPRPSRKSIIPRERRGATLFFRSFVFSFTYFLVFSFSSPFSSSIFRGLFYETAHKKISVSGAKCVTTPGQSRHHHMHADRKIHKPARCNCKKSRSSTSDRKLAEPPFRPVALKLERGSGLFAPTAQIFWSSILFFIDNHFLAG